MKTLSDTLRDADPLRHEADRIEGGARDRLRKMVAAAAASDATTPSSGWFPTRLAMMTVITLIPIGIMAVGSQMWWSGGTTLQAAVRFEVRLAEEVPGPGLDRAQIAGSNRVIYLHHEIIVTNDDIAQSRVVPGDGPSRFGVGVEFKAAGAHRMQQATASHIGRPVAILIDGDVVTAPVVRGPVGTSGVISGDFTRAEAERIVNGIVSR